MVKGGNKMPNSIILIGPRQWGKDHQDYLRTNGMTSMQYSAKISRNVEDRLNQLHGTPFGLYIYVPKIYTCDGKIPPYLGSGKIEHKGQVIDFRVSRIPIPSPWPTINGPMRYDKYHQFQYEYWFKVDKLENCDLGINKFEICLTNGLLRRYSVSEWARIWRGNIVFANAP